MAIGTVKFFKAEKGWGAISTDELPEGQDVFVHFSAIEMAGCRELSPGDQVEFTYQPAVQDSFRYIANSVRRLSAGPAPTLRRTETGVRIARPDTPDTPLRPKRRA